MILPARRKALFCALLATTAACGLTAAPAQAQTPGSVPPPPVRQAVDENGVDVARGTFNAAQPSISIGADYPHGLVYAAVNAGSGWFNGANSLIHKSGTTFTVSVGGQSDSFTQSGTTFTPTEANGASLADTGSGYTYTSRNGLVATFLKNTGGLPFWDATVARATGITFPDGTHVHFYHKIVPFCVGGEEGDPPEVPLTCPSGSAYALRLQSITNNHGYQLKFTYASNTLDQRDPSTSYDVWSAAVTVRAINNAVDYCAPGGDTCPAFSQSWPTLTFTGGGTQLTVSTPSGESTRFTYGADGITGIRRPGAASDNVVVTYSGGKVASTTIAGVTHNYAYSDSGNVRTTTVTAPGGSQRVYSSDTTKFRITSFRDELNRTTLYVYDSSGRPTKVTAPEGNRAELTYDARGNVTQTRAVAKAGWGLADIVASAVYPATCANQKICNQPTSTTDARGNTTDYTYDATHGGPLTVTLSAPSAGAVRPQTRFAYTPLQAYFKNSSGAIVASGESVHLTSSTSACQTLASCAGTADEVKTTIAWGPQSAGTANNLVPVSTSSGSGNGALTATTTMTYDNLGNMLTADGPLPGSGDTATFRYDGDRRLFGTISPDPDDAGPLLRQAQRNTWTNGLLAKVERGTIAGTSDSAWTGFTPLEAVETGYDAQFRPATSKLSAGGTTYALTQTSYDTRGRPECVAQRMNPAEFASPNPNACLTGTVHATYGPDRIARTYYNEASEIAQLRIAVGTAQEAAEATNAYSNNGRLFTVTDTEGNKTTLEYDGHDRLAKTLFPSPTKGSGTSSTTDYEQFTYDAAGNVTALRNRANQTIAFTFDALDRLTLKDLPGTEPDVSYSYDLLGQLTGASQTGHALSFTYDALGRNLTQVNAVGTITSAWDLAGRPTRLTYPDGFFLDYDYQPNGYEMTKIRENGATSGIGVLATFAYDSLGRRISLTRGNGTVTTYAWDPVSRLSQLADNLAGTAHDQNVTFAYNPAAQIATRTGTNDYYAWSGLAAGTTDSTANGLNQLISHGGAALTYDAKGNLTGDGGQTYSYSSENLLTAMGSEAFLKYDPLMRLDQAVWWSWDRRTYDGEDLLAETNATTGAVVKRFVHGPGVDEPLVWYEGATRRFLHADERGTIAAASNDSGTAWNINSFDEYGRTGWIEPQRFAFTGQAWFQEFGLYYFKARWYHPQLGRFLQPDPIGYEDGMNLYPYAGADPVNATDPSGLCIASDEKSMPSGTCAPGVGTLIGGHTCVSCTGFFPGSLSTNATFNFSTSRPILEIVQKGPSFGGGETKPWFVRPLAGELTKLAAGSPISADEWGGVKPWVTEALAQGEVQFARLGPIKAIGRLIGLGGKQGPSIIWKYRTHSADRLRKAGINPAKAEQRVLSAIQRWRTPLRPGDNLRANFRIDGKWVQWRAQVRPDGSVSVGTIHPLTPRVTQ